MLQPHRKIGPPPSVVQSIRAILMSTWLNVLLVCIPISWTLNYTEKNQPTLVFLFSFLAIIPLAKLLAFSTDQLSIRVGQTLAGLINATLGNAVELIVAIIALTKCQLHIVQSSLVGSILSNLLLVLGMCFFAGGTRFSEQGFGISATQLNSSLLTISVIAVLLPAAFHFVLIGQITASSEVDDILSLSHGVAIVLLFIYICYLFFQLQTHSSLYDGKDIPQSVTYHTQKEKHGTSTQTDGETSRQAHSDEEAAREQEEYDEIPQMSLLMTIVSLVIITVFVAVTAEFLVDSIDGLTASGKIKKEFVGIILLPIVGNAAEHVTAVTVSVKDKLTLSLGVAVGSSIQIALFVIPFMVILGWIIGKPLTLLFDPYESIVLFLSVLTVNYCVQDGKSNWLEGMILMCLYCILGVTFWFYPGLDSPVTCS
jgi:Ca2+:H+ antiporter